MEGNLKQLYEKMQESIRIANLTGENALHSIHGCLAAVRETMAELESMIDDPENTKDSDHIFLGKEVLPRFRSEYYFYSDLLFIEVNKPVGKGKELIRYYTGLLKEKELFFQRNRFLYSYYRLGRTDLDHFLFSNQRTETSSGSFPFLELQQELLNDCTKLFSMILGYERITEFLKKGIRELKGGKKQEPESKKQPYLWTDSKAALIELAYALQSRGSINQGKGDVKSIIRALEETFNVETGNFYRTFQSMRIRKKNRTVFLDSLRESLEKRMDETDMD